ncbi:T86 [Tupaiid betaherpesvirus 1]|uniref:T86 n=1 Tax=Tupaiid herpesvirus 1 (strain 1) TaxID=10397 RepID=Q91TL1_TUHV1|nr:T86 [Tupaiid betaherpesvirus 1]AAK57130.1 T86 [Tupaiid betaherpesvirus 1]
MENWTAAELLSKTDVASDVLLHIKTTVGEELFDNLRLYYGDDPSRYHLSFEAIFGIYCSRMEWVTFLSTALALAAHTVRFDDLNKMSTGKMLFYIQVPRVATGAGLPASHQTTIMVTKYTEKSPITIPFELSAASLLHLKETFEETLLDRLLNLEALNTVLRTVKNTADAMERGLVHNFLLTLLRKAPPHFVLQTLREHSHLHRQSLTRVQRANILQSFKNKMLANLFLLNRYRDPEYLQRVLLQLLDASSDSILDNPATYVTGSGARVAGVLVGTAPVIQHLLHALRPLVTRDQVRAPAAYGEFVLSKENAVTAIAHHAILADFESQAARVATEKAADDLADPQFLRPEAAFTHLPMDILHLGEKNVALEHLRRVYKNTDTLDPLEQTVELTFFFPLGLYLPLDGQAYSTLDNEVKLTDAALHQLPVACYFYNKDRVLQKLDFADALRSLCHPLLYDGEPTRQAFVAAGAAAGEPAAPPVPVGGPGGGGTGGPAPALDRCVFPTEPLGGLARRLVHFYQRRQEVPRTTNEIKQDFGPADFFKPANVTLHTELHPFFDLTRYQEHHETAALCTPRVLVGNLPLGLAPPDFQEARGRQLLEHAKVRPPPDAEATLRLAALALHDPQYPELFYLLDVLVHGHAEAFAAARALLARCANAYFHQRGGLAFAHSFDLVRLIATQLGDGLLQPAVHAHYRQLLGLVRFLHRVSRLSGLNGQLAEEPLLAYVSALHDRRLYPPFLNRLPREDADVQLVADRQPLRAAQLEARNHGISDVPRLHAMDEDEPLFVEAERLRDDELALHKIYYYCVLPALTNNRACGLGLHLKTLLVELFYREPFVAATEADFAQGRVAHDTLLAQLLDPVAVDAHVGVSAAARELFALLPYVGEHARLLEIRSPLDAAQRHGAPDFAARHHALYNGCCATTAPRLLRAYAYAVPFHRFYADPQIAAGLSDDIRRYLEEFPHYLRHDGGFPLHPALAHEYRQWHRSPFSRYSAHCPQQLSSVLALLAMHHKLSPVATALQSRLRLHPGFALTLVRTDTFEADRLLYSTKSSTALILNHPIVTKEERDINTVYHVTQNINSVDMSLGYTSATCTAHLRRVRSDMGARVQDLFRVFPMHVYRHPEVDRWLRQFTGAERTDLLDADAVSLLTFGRRTVPPPAQVLHGQLAVCEVILTPVTADLSYFQLPNSPRGRSACLFSVDPYDRDAAERALYDHAEPNGHTFASTVNPWASQKGSLGDVLYNLAHRDRLGYNSRLYSPCTQFFSTEEILRANRTLFRTIDEYLTRSRDCIRGDTEIQYVCVDGTEGLVEKPCQLFQEAYPIYMSSTPGLLEAQQQQQNRTGGPGAGGAGHPARAAAASVDGSRAHFGHYLIAETLPLQQSILLDL